MRRDDDDDDDDVSARSAVADCVRCTSGGDACCGVGAGLLSKLTRRSPFQSKGARRAARRVLLCAVPENVSALAVAVQQVACRPPSPAAP
jgi:hypothetical protein